MRSTVQMNPTIRILEDLKAVEEHLGPEVSKSSISGGGRLGGRYAVEAALRHKDFVDLADCLRSEWTLALRLFIGFLDPERQVDPMVNEAPLVPGTAEETLRPIVVPWKHDFRLMSGMW